MRPASLLSCQTRRFRVILVNTFLLSGLTCLCLSSQWWTNGHPGTSSPAQYRGPYIYHHDQTLALLYFHPDGEMCVVGLELGFEGKLLAGQEISQCRLILAENGDNEDKIQLLNHYSQQMPVVEVNFQEIMATIDVCNNLADPDIGQTTYTEEKEASRINILTLTRGILPGTLWCGVNDMAGDFTRLGTNKELDRCCRGHDHCPVKVKPFRRKYGLFNLDLYTKSHCFCDAKFYNCLKNVDDEKARAVGDFFFNVISVKCIEERAKGHCLERSSNTSQATAPNRRTIFNLGISLEVENPSNCLRWQEDPGSKFYEFKTRKHF